MKNKFERPNLLLLLYFNKNYIKIYENNLY